MVSELEDFARSHLGPVRLRHMPRARGRVHVIEIVDDSGRTWYAKQLVRRVKFDAEARAYRHWGHLPFIPELGAVDAYRRCLLVRGLPGEPPPWDSPRVLGAAGRRLSALHEVAPAPEWTDDWRGMACRELNYHLASLRDRAVPAPADLARRALGSLTTLEGLPLTVTHGDYQPYNWRRGARGRLYVFDFGQAALRPAVHDLVRLRYSVCWERPKLLDRVLSGYGRALSAVERRYLDLSLMVRAVAGLNLGLLRDQPVMVAHAHRVLAHPRVRQLGV